MCLLIKPVVLTHMTKRQQLCNILISSKTRAWVRQTRQCKPLWINTQPPNTRTERNKSCMFERFISILATGGIRTHSPIYYSYSRVRGSCCASPCTVYQSHPWLLYVNTVYPRETENKKTVAVFCWCNASSKQEKCHFVQRKDVSFDPRCFQLQSAGSLYVLS